MNIMLFGDEDGEELTHEPLPHEEIT